MLTVCSRIVVPYDDSELSKKALEMAMVLAKQDEKIELNVISVVEVPTSIAYYGTINIESIREAGVKAAKEIMQDVDEKLNTLPNKTKTMVVEGNPAHLIVDFVKRDNADLVVMGSRGLSGIKEMVLGSVSHNVVQKSPCPVFIVK